MAGVKDLSFGKTMNGLQNFSWSGTLTGDKIVTNDIDILVKGTTAHLTVGSAGNEIADKDYVDSAHTGLYLKLNGTSEMTGDIDCGNQDIVDCKDIELKGVNYQFPSSIGTANQVLSIDTVGSPNTLKWASPAAVSGAIMADGSATVTANIPFNSNKITGLANGTVSTDAATYGQIPAAQVNSDWNSSSGVTEILNKPTIPSAQVNSDWNSSSGVTEILNKPTIPSAQVNSDWNSSSGVTEILNKPTIPSAQVNSDWNSSSGVTEILNKPTIPSAQVNSDWNSSTGVTEILNKPTIPSAQVNSDWNSTTGVSKILNKPTVLTNPMTATLDCDSNNISNIGSVSSYDLPDNRGTANYFLKTDGVGGTSWSATAGGGGAVLTAGSAMDGVSSGSNTGITNLNGISLAYTSGGGGAVTYTDIDGVGDINQYQTGTVTFGKTLLGAGYSFPTSSSTAGFVLALNPSDNTQLTFQEKAGGVWTDTAAGAGTKYDTVTIKGTQADKAVSIGYNTATIERPVKLLVYEGSGVANIISRQQLDYRVFDKEISTNNFTLFEAWNGSGFAGQAGANSIYMRGTAYTGSSPCIGLQSHLVGEAKGTGTNEMFVNRGSINAATKLSVGLPNLLTDPESCFVAQGAVDITPSQRGIHAGDYTAGGGDYGALEVVGDTGGFIDFHKADGLGATQGRIITNHTTGTFTAGGKSYVTLNTFDNGTVLGMTGDVIEDYEQGLYFHNAAYNQYGIAREAGAWSGATLPHLRIAFASGIKFVTSSANQFNYYFDSLGVAAPKIQFRGTGSIISEFNPLPRVTGVITSAGAITWGRNLTTVNRNATGYYTVYWSAGIFTSNRYTVQVTPIGAWYVTASTYVKNNTNVGVLISANVSGTAAPFDCPFDITITGW